MIPAPHLVALRGRLKGQAYPLDDEFPIGRNGETLPLSEMSVSRRHCVIRKQGARYVLTDLGSHNGTLVNGERVTTRILEHSDRIMIGDSEFIAVLSDDDVATTPGDVQFVDQDIDLTRTIHLNAENAEYLHPDKALAQSINDERVRQDLTTLLRIGTTVSDAAGADSFQGRLIDLILEVIPADAGAILAARPDGTWIPLVTEGFSGPRRVSRTVVDRVLRERTAILTNTIQADGINAPSLMASEARALLCVPLIVRNRAVGVIYLVCTKNNASFDEGHLQLLTAIAAMTASPLETARQVEWLQSENRRLRTDLDAGHQMIGNSTGMDEIFSFISRVAASDSTVLVDGESGTGKELVARAIHRMSSRANMPFIPVNCAAMTETLVESELFGHERGAFTGAIALNKGKFETAEGGTIFLDEIGELPMPTQSKLLRVLQEREINRVGNPRPIKINVRVIAATNRNLEEEIRNGRFRKDLFYRLNVVAATLPPLRDRREDIMPLAEHFLAQSSVSCNRRVTGISAEAASYLMNYDWPGNIRELQNTIERAVVLGLSDTVLPDDLPEALLEATSGQPATSASDGFHASVRENKRRLIQKALEQSGGNHLEAAKLLGLNRTYLHRLIRSLGV